MSPDQIAAVLWRRRLTFFVTAAACIGAVVAVTLVLPKTYRATSTLLVGTPKSNFQTTDLLNQVTRTYSTLAANPNVAEAVAARLPFPITRDELMKKISITPIESTQLIEISAEARSPARAELYANAYANGFVEQVETGLGPKSLSQVAVIETATLPSSPVKPNPPLYIGLGSLLALLLAFGAATLRERLDRRVRVSAEDDSFFGYPILARVPRRRRRRAVDHVVRDRFALLKTNLDFLAEQKPRVVIATSPAVSEGKSTVAMRLALACAADDERVVLVEGDLRKPGLRRAAGLEDDPDQAGLADYLAGGVGEYDVLSTDPAYPNVTFVWSGYAAPEPVTLLSSHRLESLIDSLRLDFDRVIVDSPPISVGADASLLAARADAVLYVVNEPSTTRTQARSGIGQVEKVRPAQIGIVLNRSRSVKSDSYYYAGAAERDRRARRTSRPEIRT
ncbi:MAG TPA: polysaccharide biosynthesis tyrosine autokinase [Gaiellaceae bacterium]|jgi:capsular exopolysaccharide synthesis family protein|nr:polysaccharide biosynthesis tyrosine autokinase [Gaiellaceae bacterium]